MLGGFAGTGSTEPVAAQPSPEVLRLLAGGQRRNVNIYLFYFFSAANSGLWAGPGSWRLFLFYVSFSAAVELKIKMCWDLIPNKNAGALPAGPLG